jgi:GNAT superfamily N-acetyltransferase
VRPGVRYGLVADARALGDYEDMIVTYWELPDQARAHVSELSRFWAPGLVPAHRWVAYDDGGRPIGKALLSLAAPAGVAAIYGMSVRPEARGRGVARGLTVTLLKQARELGCRRVVLHSSEMAVGLYARAGFVERCSFAVYATAQLWSKPEH